MIPIGIASSQQPTITPGPGWCPATLNSDVLALFPGALTPDISGLKFYVEDSEGLFLCGSPIPGGLRPAPDPGSIVWIEVGNFHTALQPSANARAGIAGAVLDDGGMESAGAIVSIHNASMRQTDYSGAESNGVPIYIPTNDPLPELTAIGFDGDGYIWFRTDSSAVIRAEDLDTSTDGTGIFTGRLLTGTGEVPTHYLLLGILDLTMLGVSGNAEGEFIVDQALMDLDYISGEDWCGNEIIPTATREEYLLDATRAEITSAGYVPFSLYSETDLSNYTRFQDLAVGEGSLVEHARAPKGFSTGEHKPFGLYQSGEIVAFEAELGVSGDVNTAGVQLFLSVGGIPATGTLTLNNGMGSPELVITVSGGADITFPASTLVRVGLYFNNVTGEFGAIVGGDDKGYLGEFSPSPGVFPAALFNENLPTPSTNPYSVHLATSLEDMQFTNYPPGTVNIFGWAVN